MNEDENSDHGKQAYATQEKKRITPTERGGDRTPKAIPNR